MAETGKKELFGGFGEFDTAGELNMAACGLKEEGDRESLFKLAQENGIDREDAQDYLDGISTELATPYTAAIGKLDRELETSQEKQVLGVIVEMAKQMCQDSAFAEAVRRKGKRAEEIFALMRKGAEKHRQGQCAISCGTDHQLFGILSAYYIDGKKAAEKKIQDLYREA